MDPDGDISLYTTPSLYTGGSDDYNYDGGSSNRNYNEADNNIERRTIMLSSIGSTNNNSPSFLQYLVHDDDDPSQRTSNAKQRKNKPSSSNTAVKPCNTVSQKTDDNRRRRFKSSTSKQKKSNSSSRCSRGRATIIESKPTPQTATTRRRRGRSRSLLKDRSFPRSLSRSKSGNKAAPTKNIMLMKFSSKKLSQRAFKSSSTTFGSTFGDITSSLRKGRDNNANTTNNGNNNNSRDGNDNNVGAEVVEIDRPEMMRSTSIRVIRRDEQSGQNDDNDNGSSCDSSHSHPLQTNSDHGKWGRRTNSPPFRRSRSSTDLLDYQQYQNRMQYSSRHTSSSFHSNNISPPSSGRRRNYSFSSQSPSTRNNYYDNDDDVSPSLSPNNYHRWGRRRSHSFDNRSHSSSFSRSSSPQYERHDRRRNSLSPYSRCSSSYQRSRNSRTRQRGRSNTRLNQPQRKQRQYGMLNNEMSLSREDRIRSIPGNRSRSQSRGRGQTPSNNAADDSYALVIRERTSSPTNSQRRHSFSSCSQSPHQQRGRRRRQDNDIKSQSPPPPMDTRSQYSSSPEIWIDVPNEDPFENSYTTFEEWSSPPPPPAQSSSPQRSSSMKRSSNHPRRGSSPFHMGNSIERRRYSDNNSLNDSSPSRARHQPSYSFDMRRRTSINSFDHDDLPQRSFRGNSLERRLSHKRKVIAPKWPDHNTQTRSKASDLSPLSQQISTSTSRSNSRPRSSSRYTKSLDMSNVELALKIIQKHKSKKLPKEGRRRRKSKSTESYDSTPGPPPPQRLERNTPSPPPIRVQSNQYDEGNDDSFRRSSTPPERRGYNNFFNDCRRLSQQSVRRCGSDICYNIFPTTEFAPPSSNSQSQLHLYNLSQSTVATSQQDYTSRHQQHQEYEMPMKNEPTTTGKEDWRKYQVKGNKKRGSQQQQRSIDDQSGWSMYEVGGSNQQQEQRSASVGRKGGRSVSAERKSKMFGREPRNKQGIERNVRSVKQMPYTDQFGDFGEFTGHVNEDGRPDGKGSMKYDNGVFYEGTWTDGCQDQKAAANYERIRGGFTSWSGKGKQASKSGMVLPWNARKNDAHDTSEKTNVRGMEWTDLNGDTGRYTGEVNNDRLPHGRGIMKYSYGLIAEGEWVTGILKEGPNDRMMSASVSMGGTGPISSGVSIASRQMSVGPLSVGPMSVASSLQYGGGMNPMICANQTGSIGAHQYAFIAQHNANMKSIMVQPQVQQPQMMMQPQAQQPQMMQPQVIMMPQRQMMAMQQQQQMVPQPKNKSSTNKPPIKEINLASNKSYPSR